MYSLAMPKTYRVQTSLTISIFQAKNHSSPKRREVAGINQTKVVLRRDLFQRRWR